MDLAIGALGQRGGHGKGKVGIAGFRRLQPPGKPAVADRIARRSRLVISCRVFKDGPGGYVGILRYANHFERRFLVDVLGAAGEGIEGEILRGAVERSILVGRAVLHGDDIVIVCGIELRAGIDRHGNRARPRHVQGNMVHAVRGIHIRGIGDQIAFDLSGDLLASAVPERELGHLGQIGRIAGPGQRGGAGHQGGKLARSRRGRQRISITQRNAILYLAVRAAEFENRGIVLGRFRTKHVHLVMAVSAVLNAGRGRHDVVFPERLGGFVVLLERPGRDSGQFFNRFVGRIAERKRLAAAGDRRGIGIVRSVRRLEGIGSLAEGRDCSRRRGSLFEEPQGHLVGRGQLRFSDDELVGVVAGLRPGDGIGAVFDTLRFPGRGIAGNHENVPSSAALGDRVTKAVSRLQNHVISLGKINSEAVGAGGSHVRSEVLALIRSVADDDIVVYRRKRIADLVIHLDKHVPAGLAGGGEDNLVIALAGDRILTDAVAYAKGCSFINDCSSIVLI